MEILVKSELQMIELATNMFKNINDTCIVLLDGNLGAGKTTFTKGIAKGLEICDIIVSPTFNIMKSYNGRLKLKHFDMYRLENNSDDLGFDDEISEQGTVSVIEWPSYYNDLNLSFPLINIKIEIVSQSERLLTIDFLNFSSDLERELKLCCNF